MQCLESYLNGLSEDTVNKEHSLKQLVLIGDDLIHCLKKRQHNPLFIVPFLKGIGILLADKIYFEPLQDDEQYGASFAKRMYAQLKKECYKATDIMKLMTSIKVFIGLTLFPKTREPALQRLMIFMGYQYPALRKQTCSELVTAIATFGERIIQSEEKQNEAFDYLSGNVWGGSDLDGIRQQRNALFDMFEIEPPKLKGLRKKKRAREEMEAAAKDNGKDNAEQKQQ